MNAVTQPAPGSEAESASLVTLVADWMSATRSRIRTTTDLAFAEAKLAAISVALMVLMGMLSALFVLGAWGLVVAGLVAVALKFGISLWLALMSLSLLNVLGAWLLWRGAVKLSRHLDFAATRQQFQNSEEADSDVDSAAATR
jgi:ABC-type nickel/cobalt efflux system permease component RcnA